MEISNIYCSNCKKDTDHEIYEFMDVDYDENGYALYSLIRQEICSDCNQQLCDQLTKPK